jgi:CheY-specific phosphatase CheX
MDYESHRSQETQKAVEDMAEEACLSLFDAYGVRLELRAPDSSASTSPSLTGIIGFTGRGITGMCLIDASEAPLAASNPAGGSLLRDWVAELSNQLAGRLKHKLLAMGVEVYITTPIVLRATRIEPLPRTKLMPRTFHAHDGFVKLWVEVETTPGFQMVPGSAEGAVAEGEALLF